jgi:hypothetical protein
MREGRRFRREIIESSRGEAVASVKFVNPVVVLPELVSFTTWLVSKNA